jgi:hypothetical protein
MNTKLSFNDRYFLACLDLFQRIVSRLEARGYSQEGAFTIARSRGSRSGDPTQ